MKHIFKDNNGAYTLLLLHGTGGSENDLLDIARHINPDANILSLRGDVEENGMARFFKRISPGVFDEDDLIMRTKQLMVTLDEMAETYQFNRKRVIAVGYSNGANIVGSFLFHNKDAFFAAALLHPMVPLKDHTVPKHDRTPVLITAGENDPICPAEETKALYNILKSANSDVSIAWFKHGHQLTTSEVDTLRQWMKEIINKND